MQFEHVTCPHCGLLCDDLTVNVNNLSLQLLNSSHSQCINAYADASIENDSIPQPLIDGKPASLESAINKSAEILSSSSQPIVNGLIADVQACREAIALTEKIGGVIDHASGKSIRKGSAIMQRFGEVKTTLAEARNRADCVIIFGEGVLTKFPRFIERILLPKKTLGVEASSKKKIYVLDIGKNNSPLSSKLENNITQIRLDFPLLESLIYHFQEVISKPDEYFSEDDANSNALIELRNIILSSNYTCVVWSSTEFRTESAEHTIQAITESIKLLMSKVRCAGLPLGGSKGENTANQVATWQTGVPLPVAFMSGSPVHNPVLYDGSTMLENKELDCLVWIATYNSSDLPPSTEIPTIVIGHPKLQCSGVSVYIPSGIPGIDHRGLACRTDGVATLPLKAIREGSLPPASLILHRIREQIG